MDRDHRLINLATAEVAAGAAPTGSPDGTALQAGPAAPLDRAGLAAAFAAFTSASQQLSASYGALAGRLTALVEALPGGVLLLDGNDRVVDANATARDMFGATLDGERWDEVRARAGSTATDSKGEFLLRDGRHIALAQKTLTPGAGRVLLLTDVTGQRKLEELLARHRRLAAMGEMAAALAHQIRTPLAAGLLYASNARRGELTGEQRDVLLGKAIGCLQDLERLIADMLQFARGAHDAGERFGLDELLDGVECALAAILLPSQALRIERPGGAVTLTGNRETLTGALINLATNALEAAGEHADVRICARATPLGTEILVQDNGPGIAAGLQDRLFEPFFTSRAEGTGLGLAVARSVARAHRGDVTLVDATPGHTTFALRLPVTAGLALAERTAAA